MNEKSQDSEKKGMFDKMLLLSVKMKAEETLKPLRTERLTWVNNGPGAPWRPVRLWDASHPLTAWTPFENVEKPRGMGSSFL